jgi:SET domain-containing protein
VRVVKLAKKGWAVQALQDIAEGTFVCEYAGEAVPPGFERDVGEMTFVIQVDRFGGTAHRFGVDGSTRANLGRVFNHSCDPNMRLVLVDEGGGAGTHAGEGGGAGGGHPPRIAFFASRDIELGEELTWRYNGRTTGGIPCLCGAERCKGWL